MQASLLPATVEALGGLSPWRGLIAAASADSFGHASTAVSGQTTCRGIGTDTAFGRWLRDPVRGSRSLGDAPGRRPVPEAVEDCPPRMTVELTGAIPGISKKWPSKSR